MIVQNYTDESKTQKEYYLSTFDSVFDDKGESLKEYIDTNFTDKSVHKDQAEYESVHSTQLDDVIRLLLGQFNNLIWQDKKDNIHYVHNMNIDEFIQTSDYAQCKKIIAGNCFGDVSLREDITIEPIYCN